MSRLHVLLYYNGRTTVRPYISLHVTASIPIVTRHYGILLYYNGRTTVRPYISLHVTASIPIVTRHYGILL
ncbi:hypothetical protein [Porphyromonas uenonis]|uniref:hypothetical protein n=1 Tax=Porphyromonas uenonis TaxID=281920 RepID=UPI0012DC16CB|nr:hypothetical protein [Porphyromonas uenonis]